MDKLWQLVDGAVDAVQSKIKSGEKQLKRAASDARTKAQAAAAEAADEAKRRVQQKTQEAKDVVKHKAEEARVAATAKSRGIGANVLDNLRSNQELATARLRENAKLLQRSASDTVDDLKKRAQQSATQASSAAQERVSEGAQKLRQTSSNVVEAMDPRASARRARNKLLMVGFIGVFLYGFGSAIPHAMANYALERGKSEEEALFRAEDAKK
ncbi:Hypothatical protein [Phytophthora megakarya]|uniref:Hypothatical protein n=1 Tax=Phytophthora megakarya TaxID=4795 RepID=A0A225VZ32_9STRA|nr:Hypothatical protein [Phytophthora megakarya]